MDLIGVPHVHVLARSLRNYSAQRRTTKTKFTNFRKFAKLVEFTRCTLNTTQAFAALCEDDAAT
jgi:hypothetical protein